MTLLGYLLFTIPDRLVFFVSHYHGGPILRTHVRDADDQLLSDYEQRLLSVSFFVQIVNILDSGAILGYYWSAIQVRGGICQQRCRRFIKKIIQLYPGLRLLPGSHSIA